MESSIQWALGVVGRKPKMYVTGHSLGAAMATVMASDLALGNLTGLMSSVEVLTFAAPRSGNAAYASGIGKLLTNWWSIQNFFDQIPHLPTQSMGVFVYLAVENCPEIGAGVVAETCLACWACR